MVSKVVGQSRNTFAVLLASFLLMRGSMEANAVTKTSTIKTHDRVEITKIKMNEIVTTIKENKRSVAVGLGAGTGIVLVSKAPSKKSKDDISDEVEEVLLDVSNSTEKILTETSTDEENKSRDEWIEPMPYTPANLGNDETVENKGNEAIIKFLDTIGANPDYVFSFLASSAAFLVSEDILVSGIAFAWILKLFRESDETSSSSAKGNEVVKAIEVDLATTSNEEEVMDSELEDLADASNIDAQILSVKLIKKLEATIGEVEEDDMTSATESPAESEEDFVADLKVNDIATEVFVESEKTESSIGMLAESNTDEMVDVQSDLETAAGVVPSDEVVDESLLDESTISSDFVVEPMDTSDVDEDSDPSSIEMESDRYASIDSLEDKAYAIIKDLGLLEEDFQ